MGLSAQKGEVPPVQNYNPAECTKTAGRYPRAVQEERAEERAEERQEVMQERTVRSCDTEYSRPTRHGWMMGEASDQGSDTSETDQATTWLIVRMTHGGISCRK